jgi:lysozyme family protein
MALFEIAFAMVLEHEGGYVNDPYDPGGETIYGISRASSSRRLGQRQAVH